MTRILFDAGFSGPACAGAASSRGAITYPLSGSFDKDLDNALLDMNMPRLSGLETLSAIKNDPELFVILIIMHAGRLLCYGGRNVSVAESRLLRRDVPQERHPARLPIPSQSPRPDGRPRGMRKGRQIALRTAGRVGRQPHGSSKRAA